jgi:hypothetical protein
MEPSRYPYDYFDPAVLVAATANLPKRNLSGSKPLSAGGSAAVKTAAAETEVAEKPEDSGNRETALPP